MDVVSTATLYALTLLALAFWVARRDHSPRPLGLGAVIVAALTYDVWWPDLPIAWGWIVLAVTVALFIIGMLNRGRGDLWHYSALVVALFGKALAWLIVAVWTQTITIPLAVVIIVLVLVLLAGFVGRRRRTTVVTNS